MMARGPSTNTCLWIWFSVIARRTQCPSRSEITMKNWPRSCTSWKDAASGVMSVRLELMRIEPVNLADLLGELEERSAVIGLALRHASVRDMKVKHLVSHQDDQR